MTRKKQPTTAGPSGPVVRAGAKGDAGAEPEELAGGWWTIELDDSMEVRLDQIDPQTREPWFLANLPVEWANSPWLRENLGAATYKAYLIGDKIEPGSGRKRRVIRQTYGPFRVGGGRPRHPTDPLPAILGKSPEYLEQPAAARGDGGPGPAAVAVVSERALTPREALDAALVKQTLEVVQRASPPAAPPTDWAKIAVAFAPLLERVLAGRAAPAADPVLEELKALRGSLEATRGKGAASTKELSEMLELVDRIRGRVGADEEEDDAAEALAIEGVPDWVPAIVRVVDRLTAPKRAPEPAPVPAEPRGEMDPMTAHLLEGARALWRESVDPPDAARRLLEAVPALYHGPLWQFLSDPQAPAYLQAWAPDLFAAEDRRTWTLELMRALHVQTRPPSPRPVEAS